MPASADPNGEPRPISTDRVDPAKNNSGVIVGEVKQTSSSTGQPEEYKTAFVKVYQDAGVIGVAMLTLLALCLVMGFFNVRLLKMYTALTESRDKLDASRTQALERIAQTVLTFQLTITAEMNGLKNEHREQHEQFNALAQNATRLIADSERKLEYLRREEISISGIKEQLTRIEGGLSRRPEKEY